MKFDVFFEQINQTCITVDAKDRNEAREKAARVYKREYATPTIAGVQDAK